MAMPWSQKHPEQAEQLKDEMRSLNSEKSMTYPGPTPPPDEVRELQVKAAELEEKLQTLAEAMGMEFILQRAQPAHWLAMKMAAHKKG